MQQAWVLDNSQTTNRYFQSDCNPTEPQTTTTFKLYPTSSTSILSELSASLLFLIQLITISSPQFKVSTTSLGSDGINELQLGIIPVLIYY